MASDGQYVPSRHQQVMPGRWRGKEEKPPEGGCLVSTPGPPSGGIRMKFAVLTGLVEVGEVSNRDIVETVFNLVLDLSFYQKVSSSGWRTRP